MVQISKIVKAWIKVFEGSVTEEHKRRAFICHGCEFAKHNKYLDFINDDMEEVKGMICSVCKCPLIAKIRSEDSCPENKW